MKVTFRLKYFDFKLLIYLVTCLLGGLIFVPGGTTGVFITVALVIVLNIAMYKFNLLKLFFVFVFLDLYSLVWGGNLGFIQLPVESIDSGLTGVSNILGYILVAFVFLKRKKLPRLNPIDYWITAFFVIGMISPFIAVDRDAASDMAFRFTQFYVLYFLVRILIRTPYDLRSYFRFVLTSFIPLFAVILFQYSSGYLVADYGNGRPGVLSSFLPYLMMLTVLPNSNRLLYWILSILSIFLSTFHGSRRVLTAIIAYLVLHFRLSWKTLFIILMVVFFGGSLYTLIPDMTKSRLNISYNIMSDMAEQGVSEEKLDRLGTGRIYLWLNALKIFRERPIFGAGLKNNVTLMDRYGGEREARAHNFFLEILVDLGIVGLTIVIVLIYLVFKQFRNISINPNFNSPFLQAMLKAYRYELIVIHLISIFGSSMLYGKSAWILYGLVGSIMGMQGAISRGRPPVSRKYSKVSN